MHHAIAGLIEQLENGSTRVLAKVALQNPRSARIIEEFRRAGALTPDSCQTFHPPTLFDEIAFRNLLRYEIIQQPRPGRYFVDERVIERLSRP